MSDARICKKVSTSWQRKKETETKDMKWTRNGECNSVSKTIIQKRFEGKNEMLLLMKATKDSSVLAKENLL